MGHGLNFLNCHDAHGVERSGIAFYDDIGEHNIGEQPQAFVYTDLSGDTAWESTFKQKAVFSSNVVVTWQINLDAQSKKENEVVGTASNGFQDFTVHKGTSKFIFKNDDGFDCFAIYFAN